MNLREIFKEAHANSKSKGWWPDDTIARVRAGDPEVLCEKFSLIHSELSEALEDLRVNGDDFSPRKTAEGKPVGFLSEFADVVIRIGDLYCALGLAYLHPPFEASYPPFKWFVRKTDNPVSYSVICIEGLHGLLGAAATYMLDNHAEYTDDGIAHRLSFIARVVGLCATQIEPSIDFPGVLHSKMAYNRTRPHRHGGKLL